MKESYAPLQELEAIRNFSSGMLPRYELVSNQIYVKTEYSMKYGFESCDLVDTPMVEKSKLDEDKEGKAVDPSHYRHLQMRIMLLSDYDAEQHLVVYNLLGDRLCVAGRLKGRKALRIHNIEAEYIALSGCCAQLENRLVVSEDEDDLEDPSKQERKIAQLDEDKGITLFTAPEEVYTVEPDISTVNVPVSTAGAEVSNVSPEVKTTTESLVYIRRRSHTLQHLKKLSFNEIKELFETTMKRVKDFVPMESDRLVPKILTGSSNRTAKTELEHEGSKRAKSNEEQSAKEEKELLEDELHKLMMIVPVEEVYVEALQVKYPIIDWEVYSEDTRKDDMDKLWSLVKERFSSTDPTDDKERTLWVELKRLFEPDIDDIIIWMDFGGNTVFGDGIAILCDSVRKYKKRRQRNSRRRHIMMALKETLKDSVKRWRQKSYDAVEMHRGIAWDKVENLSPQSTSQVLPLFEVHTPPVTYPEEVEETLGTPIEVEPLDQTKLEDVVITEYLMNISKRRAFWSLNEDILKINDSDYQYAVSIKEDTAYPCLHSPKTTKERRSIRHTQTQAILASSSEVPSVLEFLQRRKLEAKKEVAASEFSHLNHSLSHRPVSVKPDISKPDISKASSAGGKLHILKPSCERNGITPTPKESLSPTSGSKVPNSPLTGKNEESYKFPIAVKQSFNSLWSQDVRGDPDSGIDGLQIQYMHSFMRTFKSQPLKISTARCQYNISTDP
ncbi:hypothetical protein Tco_0133741 [Tanacetum coccineum]